MPVIDPKVEAIVIFDRSTGQTRVLFESANCAGDNAAELWLEQKSMHYVLYQAEEYYDEILRNRRNANNMISSHDSSSRLVFVGQVWGRVTYDVNSCVELACASLGGS